MCQCQSISRLCIGNVSSKVLANQKGRGLALSGTPTASSQHRILRSLATLVEASRYKEWSRSPILQLSRLAQLNRITHLANDLEQPDDSRSGNEAHRSCVTWGSVRLNPVAYLAHRTASCAQSGYTRNLCCVRVHNFE
jgi:hypothetical protein